MGQYQLAMMAIQPLEYPYSPPTQTQPNPPNLQVCSAGAVRRGRSGRPRHHPAALRHQLWRALQVQTSSLRSRC